MRGHPSPTPLTSAPESFCRNPSDFRPIGSRPPPFAPHFSGRHPTRGIFSKNPTRNGNGCGVAGPHPPRTPFPRGAFPTGAGPRKQFQKLRDDTRLFRCTEEKKFVPPVHTYSEKEVFHANKTAFHHRCLKGIGGSSSQDHLCPLHGTTERASTASESSCLHRDRSGADQDFFPTRPRSKIETTSWRRNDFPP